VSIRADIDNSIKPILDALKDVVYIDDNQVRSVTATLFDLRQYNKISGYVEDIKDLFYSGKDNAFGIDFRNGKTPMG
jgi:hypothetical protein